MTEPIKLTLYSRDKEQGTVKVKVVWEEPKGWFKTERKEAEIEARVFLMAETPEGYNSNPMFFIDLPNKRGPDNRICLNGIYFSDYLHHVATFRGVSYSVRGCDVWRVCGYCNGQEMYEKMCSAAGVTP